MEYELGEPISAATVAELPPQTDGKAHLGFIVDKPNASYMWLPDTKEWVTFSYVAYDDGVRRNVLVGHDESHGTGVM